jgi:DNA topoisomerase-1
LNMARQTLERRRVGRGFKYFDHEKEVTNKEDLEYFESLKIPPAWKSVEIAKSRSSKILATGYDDAGRLQYIYNPKFRAHQDREKFERILRFARALPRMRRITEEHLQHRKLDKQKVLACVVQLLDEAYFRIGNDVYAKENSSYGLTTIRSKHIDVVGDTVTFDFIGKSGKQQLKEVRDPQIARLIKKMDDLPGYEVFKYYDEDGELRRVTSDDVNEYIKEIMGEEFTAKDFRTWGGTLLATAELAAAERAHNETERAKIVATCVKKVADRLGNTPAVARSSYIDPRVINAYVKGKDLARIQQTVENMRKENFLSKEESVVLHLLGSDD